LVSWTRHAALSDGHPWALFSFTTLKMNHNFQKSSQLSRLSRLSRLLQEILQDSKRNDGNLAGIERIKKDEQIMNKIRNIHSLFTNCSQIVHNSSPGSRHPGGENNK
jgi:hypothetical protein